MAKPFDVSKSKVLQSATWPIGFNDLTLDTLQEITHLINLSVMTSAKVHQVRLLYLQENQVQVNHLLPQYCKKCTRLKYFCYSIDSENALDEKWLHALDVDTSPRKTT